MKRRKWTAEQKASDILEDLRGRPVDEVYAEHAISQNQIHQWRDQFPTQARKAFEPVCGDRLVAKLERENVKLKGMDVEQPLELNKAVCSDEARRPRQDGRAQCPAAGATQPEVHGQAHAHGRKAAAGQAQRAASDMFRVMIEGFGWVYVVELLDWRTQKAVEHLVDMRAKAWHGLSAANKAVNRQFPQGARGQVVRLMAGNGWQPTNGALPRPSPRPWAAGSRGTKRATCIRFSATEHPKPASRNASSHDSLGTGVLNRGQYRTKPSIFSDCPG